MKPSFVSLGAVCAAIGVALGAFGAHSLRNTLTPAELSLWDTATRYWQLGGLALVLFGLFRERREGSGLPGWLLLAGMLLFSVSLYALALGGPRALGAITPFGGLSLMAGFLSFAWQARRLR